MTKKLKIFGGILSLSLLVTAFIFIVGSTLATANAQSEPDTAVSPQRTIQVNGNGRVSARPDSATIRLGVTTEAITASAALEENSTRMSELISVTLAADIAEEDIQTTGLQLQPVYDTPGPGSSASNTRQLTGYQASNMVEITTMDLDGLGSLLDSAVSAGGNMIEGIRFQISDNQALLVQAREAAVADARTKAEQLTDLLGAQLGSVLTITEFNSSSPSPVFAAEQAVGGANVPLAPGSQEVEVSIQVTWQIID